MNRDNVGIVVRLRPVRHSRCQQELVIANTHLLFNPKRGDIKLAQLQLLLAATDHMAYAEHMHQSYYPVIVCGDMNAEPYCDLYRFLAEGGLNYEGLLIRNMAGQQERGNNNCMGKILLPETMGVTDNCQYTSDVVQRAKKEKRKNKTGPSETEKKVKNDNKESVEENNSSHSEGHASTRPSSSPSQPFCFSTGKLTHNLKLRSVYENRRYRRDGRYLHRHNWDVTTHHEKANCTVDYIFYSCRLSQKRLKSHRQESDGMLKLCERLTLLTNEEMEQYGCLPSRDISSDHLILMAKFALAIN